MKLKPDPNHVNTWADRWLSFRFRCVLRIMGLLLYDTHWLVSGMREYDTRCTDMHATNSASRVPHLLHTFHANIYRDMGDKAPPRMPGFKLMSPQELLDMFGTTDTKEAIKRMQLHQKEVFKEMTARPDSQEALRRWREQNPETEIEPEAADYPRNPKSPWGRP